MLDQTHAPASREKMQTIPCDLSAYALTETGPSSWSARTDDAPPPRPRSTPGVVTIAPTDVPSVAVSHESLLEHVTLREAFVIASIDGESSLEALLEMLDMPNGEALTIICELCASGILSLASASPRACAP